MITYKEYRCDGELCDPLWYAKEGADIVDITVNFCHVDEATGILPERWGWYPKERKVRCPRCVEYKQEYTRCIEDEEEKE